MISGLQIQWNPGLDNAGLTLQEVMDSLPGYESDMIHFMVRLFENPASMIAFKGAITLKRHDALHIILGRGLLPQDEAFVIGFTMGTSKNISWLEVKLYELISTRLYPKDYRFSKMHLKVFELGVEFGKRILANRVYNFPFENHLSSTIGELRKILRIDAIELRDIYRQELSIVPSSIESLRLPVTLDIGLKPAKLEDFRGHRNLLMHHNMHLIESEGG
jgi:hypothetical protein